MLLNSNERHMFQSTLLFVYMNMCNSKIKMAQHKVKDNGFKVQLLLLCEDVQIQCQSKSRGEGQLKYLGMLLSDTPETQRVGG